MKSILQTAALLGAMLAVTAQAQVTLINDTFSDLGRTNGADPLDAQWYTITNNAATTSAASGALRVTSQSGLLSHPHLITHFTQTTLGLGDTISFSFDFSSTKDTANSNNRIRWGLYESGGTLQSSDLAATSVDAMYQDTLGYTVFAPRNTLGSPVLLNARIADTTADVTPISALTTANVAISGATFNTTVSTTAATYASSGSLLLTRTATGYDYTFGYAGTSFSGTTTEFTTDTFDMLDIWSINDAGGGNHFTIDNVLVTYTAAIPEPSSYTIFAGIAGLAGACVLRRRRGKA